MTRPKVGVLALQGGFRAHRAMFEQAGAQTSEVRLPEHLADLDAIAIPGGESTVISKLLSSSGLEAQLQDKLASGLPAFGTCAGMTLLASEIRDGIAGQRSLGVIDLTVRRNGIGPQSHSNETLLDIDGLGVPFPAIFIRPPVVTRTGDDVETLADINSQAVLCRQGSVMTASFHPELSSDFRVHSLFLQGL